MSAQQNKEIVSRLFYEVWNDDNMEAAKEIINDDYISSENIIPHFKRGLEVFTADIKFYREMYSNLNFKIERMLTEGDTVVAWRATGVANNEFFTSRVGKEENKEVRAEGVTLNRIADDKIIESRFYWPRDPLFP